MGEIKQIENLFSIPVSINYEDTDAGGVVYYGNYLSYMERVRNAFLRHHGFPLTQLINDYQIIFVVRDVSIRYLSPARLDDELTATIEIETMGGASVVFRHQICRKNECLVEAKIKLAIINSETFKPAKIPGALKQCLRPI